nr:(2Fe-2S)-binding protein [Flavimaribacter sediminis]
MSLTVNGRQVSTEIDPRLNLADFLRERLSLKGTHLGCEHGACGACTVLMDGMPIRSCITMAASCDGVEITTVEGYDDNKLMSRLRRAFREEHALQCGYCTPGMLATAYDIVSRLDRADENEIRAALAGCVCRCTGYRGIVRAIERCIAEKNA